jgi:hypothetical protein
LFLIKFILHFDIQKCEWVVGQHNCCSYIHFVAYKIISYSVFFLSIGYSLSINRFLGKSCPQRFRCLRYQSGN